MSKHPKIFLSHSHKDRHTATEIQILLETNGGETYLDQDKIQVADILPERIMEGINWCDIFLLIWSSNAARSNWVGNEWNTAYDLRKKIIPYSLDATPLPPVLQNLVYVEANDQEHGNAKLLTSVFGKDFAPDPTTLFPGKWHATVDAFGMAQGTYDLELRENGQMEGKGGVSDSGIAGNMARQLGVGNLLNMRIPVHGSWTYEQVSKTLTIEMSTSVVLGRQQNDTIRIQATGYEKGAIVGQDLGGRTWTLRREVKSAPALVVDPKQEVQKGFQYIIESAKDSPALAVLLASYCVGAQDKYRNDIYLPTQKARKVMQTQGADFQRAYKDFLQALERGGWIK